MGIGSYTSNLIGLTPATTYYVRAYATNNVGTAYGEERTFTTPASQDGEPCHGAVTLTDVDGNTYNTVQIGKQCWMKENLRTTKYANGASISQGSYTSTSITVAYWYYPNNSSSNKATYGLLYNWKALMRNSSSSSANPSGVQGICPNGWHVPSDAEWTQLINYVSSQPQYQCGSTGMNHAKALASTTGWEASTSTCSVGNNQGGNNATGFNALPAGSATANFGQTANFWSTTEYYYVLTYNKAYVYYTNGNKERGFSVRCVKD